MSASTFQPRKVTIATAIRASGFAAIATIGLLIALTCYLWAEPQPTSAPMWLKNGANVVPRTSPLNMGRVPVLHVTLEAFKELARDQPYVVSYRQEWQMGTAAWHDADSWNIVYVMSEPNTHVLTVALQEIPWSNPMGWNTTTAFDPRAGTFTESSAGRSFWLLGFGMVIFLLCGGVSIYLYDRRYDAET